MKNHFNHQQDIQHTLSFVKNFLTDSVREVNPWNNIKIMHTNLKADFMSGLTVAIIALPLALAFGVGSGLGPAAGIWGAIAGGIFGGIFGGSKVGVSGPTGPLMVQLAAIMVAFHTVSGELDVVAAFSIVFLSGLILVGLSMLRIARFIYYTPYSVVAGFMCGIGVIVMLLEFNTFLGVPSAHNVKEAIKDVPYALMNARPESLLVSIPTFLVLFIWPKITQKYSRLQALPATLIALAIGTTIAKVLDLNILYIGEIPTGLPTLHIPEFSKFGDYFLPALSLAGLTIFDCLLTCVVADQMTGTRHSSDRETFGQGIANMAAGLFGGLTPATSTMNTVSNIKTGGKTPMASVFHGLILLAVVLGLGPLAEGIPMACLAAILLKVGINILDYRIIPVLHKLPFNDMIVFWSVLLITIWQDLLVAMGVGVALAFFRFVQEISTAYKHQISYLDKKEKTHYNLDETQEKVKLLKPQGPLFFGAVDSLVRSYQKAAKHHILIIDLSDVSMLDLSGAYALEDLVNDTEAKGIKVIITGASSKIEKVLESVKVVDHLGKDHFLEIQENKIKNFNPYKIAG
ncbi:SulP family inorganic anion transporter [Chondrinema litorale]|uniref:SulP family inorganic anion transporter n=1 Tax=Chondrinema litorale TaxID=2994555 RepID=UPI002542722C|nr:SulP family inorganic anion transporter [Chondrinema litorale]UZR93724.1 SulP family inorganic anion transporter [Chondrinema litorale]